MAKQDQLSRPVSEFASPVETALRSDLTVAQGLAALRKRKIEQKIIYFYVVDAQDRLLGVIPSRKLLLSDPTRSVADVMDTPAISVTASTTLEEAMEVFAMYRLLALPVVDEGNRLVGCIDIQLYADEAVDLAEAERLSDLFQLMGLSVQQLRRGSAFAAYRLRMPWLVCNILGGVACAIIAAVFHQALAKVLILAMFIPLVLTLSEAISMQSMTLSLQYLHRGAMKRWGVLRRTAGEWKTAVLLGATSALAVALAASFWTEGRRSVAVIAASVVASMVSAATVGTAVPMLLHLVKLDPKVAAGPVVLMIGDILTMVIYLGLATAFLL